MRRRFLRPSALLVGLDMLYTMTKAVLYDRIDFLLSWNLTHLGNPIFLEVYDFNQKRGLLTPRLLDPDTFMGIMKIQNNQEEEI